MDDMSQYMQQMNAAAASQSLSDASVAAQNAKEQAKTEYQRFKQKVVEGVLARSASTCSRRRWRKVG